jgi:8-oxo-dGTP pyrophosphatase MutT (NUDIX family)
VSDGEPGATSPSVPPASVEPLRAAGIMLTAPDGRVLLLRRTGRDHAGEWAFPGGGVEAEESPEDCARREFVEETGGEYSGKLAPWTRRIKDGVDFTTFLGAADAFVPVLNEEHDMFAWAGRAAALTLPLHPGARVALARFDMHELDIAKAMAAGDLTSPQRYSNMLLVAIRITGTGLAYRPSHDEYPWRDPALYLNEEFLQRCNGLPVILEHPRKSMLNTKEYRDRNIGSVFLPFIRGNEVWAIAKVFDMDVAEMIETERMSTSPGLTCDGVEVTMKDGTTLLIENEPDVLDHIALLFSHPQGTGKGGTGVWDQGRGMEGVHSVDATNPAQWSKLDVIVRQLKLHELSRMANR